MTKCSFAGHALLLSLALAMGAAASAAAEVDPNTVVLAPHRAIYDLKLARTRGRTLESVRGRIVYDFSGSACEGYALAFRQVTELDSGEGKVAVSDLRSTTWEEGNAKSFRFGSQNFLNRNLGDVVEGRAERGSANVTVSLKKPQQKTFEIENIVFPTEHMRRIIAAAREGRTLLELRVFDGTETGERIYDTLAVIGRPIPPDEKKPTDAAAGQPSLAALTRWPITISYFDKSKRGGEQTPLYAITFEVYDNGISRALTLDYGDFLLSGEMSSLELLEAKPCR